LVYIDECGLDESIQRNYARASIGQKVLEDISGNRTARTSIIAGLNRENILAPWHFSGYCNTDVILTWVKNELLPTLKSGLTIIWDNATFHQSPQIKALIESVGCKLIFLPPYSPDLNPIEHYWAKLKACIRRIKTAQMTIPETLALIFKKAQKF
jgi:transposase